MLRFTSYKKGTHMTQDRETVVVTDGGGGNSSSGVILGIVVIILVLVGIWFFLLGGPNGNSKGGTDVNIDVNLPSIEVPAPS